jgi:hypothetical protein
MKLAFIIPYYHLGHFGVRSMCATLNAAGHETSIIFVQDGSNSIEASDANPYEESFLSDIVQLTEGFDLVGLSLMSCHFHKASQITRGIQERLRIPVVWGGAHPIVMPDQCLEIADGVCLGEADE